MEERYTDGRDETEGVATSNLSLLAIGSLILVLLEGGSSDFSVGRPIDRRQSSASLKRSPHIYSGRETSPALYRPGRPGTDDGGGSSLGQYLNSEGRKGLLRGLDGSG